MLRRRLQRHQIYHVHKADLYVGEILAQQVNRSQSLKRGDVTGAGNDHVGLAVLIGTGPIPDSDASGAVLDGSLHLEPLQGRLLSRDDYIDVMPAAQAVIGHGKQGVGIGRQIDAHDIRFLVHHKIDEAGVLMAEAVVVLPPDVRSQQIV